MVKGRGNRFVWDDDNPIVFKSRCYLCKYKHRGQMGCDAFPDALPHPLSVGDVMHWPDLPFEGDGGIRFELHPEFAGKMLPRLEKELVEAGVVSYDELVDPLKYYDLERYLYETVSGRFECQGWLCAFDLISIISWKADRSKSKFAARLMTHAKAKDLEGAARELTGKIRGAETPRDRFVVLAGEWGFRLPTTSAILTVLYQDDFTVYDERVCNQLGEFHNLVHLTNLDRLWAGYLDFKQAVGGAADARLSLRNKDRLLFGMSKAEQLRADIKRGFS